MKRYKYTLNIAVTGDDNLNQEVTFRLDSFLPPGYFVEAIKLCAFGYEAPAHESEKEQ